MLSIELIDRTDGRQSQVFFATQNYFTLDASVTLQVSSKVELSVLSIAYPVIFAALAQT